MRKDKWKKNNWDKWTFWKKARHVLAVIASVIAVVAMWLVFAYVLLIWFGVYGFILKFRDKVLLEFAHVIFG